MKIAQIICRNQIEELLEIRSSGPDLLVNLPSGTPHTVSQSLQKPQEISG
jgi:hypothetical protein